jgi:imidazolonepropionase-like amidohydrolase
MPKFAEEHRLGPAARGFKSGPMITVPGGYPDIVWHSDTNYEVENVEEARAAVADLIDRGADVIKIALEPGGEEDPWPILDLQEVQAIVQEAHARGRLVRAHVGRTNGTEVLDIILRGGIDIIDHVPLPVFSAWEAYDLIKESGHYEMTTAERERLAHLAARHVVMVPTLSAYTLWCESPRLTIQQRQGCYAFYEEPVHEFHDLGGTVALANDFGVDDTLERGVPLREMQLLMDAGLTPMEVVEASTRNAALVCGHGEELGTLEPGTLADIIIVDRNPLEDIEAMSRVIMVIKGGKIIVPAGSSQQY